MFNAFRIKRISLQTSLKIKKRKLLALRVDLVTVPKKNLYISMCIDLEIDRQL